jgi:hypothetical protein
MTTAYHLLNNSSGGKINIQAHPGSGKTTWITNGVTNSFLKVKNSMGIAFLTQQTKQNQTAQETTFKDKGTGSFKQIEYPTSLACILRLALKIVFSNRKVKISLAKEAMKVMQSEEGIKQWIKTIKPKSSSDL